MESGQVTSGLRHQSCKPSHEIQWPGKKAYLKYTRCESEIELTRRTKRMMDPVNIVNPGKLFDL